MPIIINGGSRRAGGWWANHLENGEKNEKVTLVEVVGLSGTTATELFREMYALSRGSDSKATNYFYQANINPRGDEHLTPEQRHEAKELLLKNLGLSGQPHFVYEHEKNGRLHMHVIAFRIDLENQRAISDSLTAAIHERTSRELEIKFDLERGKSILVPDRDFERPERRPKKYESFRAAETGIDPATVKADARQHWHSADSGKSFKAALGASGEYILAAGDRRDFVIIDRAGDDHSLGRRLGVKAAEINARMADLDRAQLPSVEQAQAMQRTRTAEREANASRTAEPDAPNFDRDAANRDWEEKIAAAGIAADRAMQEARDAAKGRRDDTRPDGPVNRPEPEDMRPLGKTAGEIRAAWTLSRSAEQLDEALAARGVTLAEVSAGEARQSERTAAFAKEVGNYARVLKEGEIVAVNAHGDVHRLDQRTTGDLRPEIEARLAGIDRAGLSSVTDAKEAMQEAARAAWRDERQAEREKARPPSVIESRIVECVEQARISGAVIECDDEGRRIFGAEAFAARLQQAGIAVARVTAADVLALDALRRDEELARFAAETNREARPAHRFAEVKEGELAAVTPRGDVHRLDPDKLGGAVQQLAANLPSVTEARAAFETDREQTAELWAQRRADNTVAHEAYAQAAEARHEMGDTVRAGRDALGTAPATVGRGFKAARSVFEGAAKAAETIIAAVSEFLMPTAPMSKDQAERAARSADEQADANATAAAAQEKAETARRANAEQNRAAQQEENFAARYGTPPTRGREYDDDRGRERERF